MGWVREHGIELASLGVALFGAGSTLTFLAESAEMVTRDPLQASALAITTFSLGLGLGNCIRGRHDAKLRDEEIEGIKTLQAREVDGLRSSHTREVDELRSSQAREVEALEKARSSAVAELEDEIESLRDPAKEVLRQVGGMGDEWLSALALFRFKGDSFEVRSGGRLDRLLQAISDGLPETPVIGRTEAVGGNPVWHRLPLFLAIHDDGPVSERMLLLRQQGKPFDVEAMPVGRGEMADGGAAVSAIDSRALVLAVAEARLVLRLWRESSLKVGPAELPASRSLYAHGGVARLDVPDGEPVEGCSVQLSDSWRAMMADPAALSAVSARAGGLEGPGIDGTQGA